VSVRPGADALISPLGLDLEARLERAFAADPTPAQLATVDRRVAAAVAIPRPVVGRFGGARWVRRAALLALSMVVVGGASATLLSLYGGMGSGGYQVAWDRSTKLGLSEIHGGYRVILEAAYADAAQTMLAISIIDTEPGRSSGVGLRGADLTDEVGRPYRMTSGGSTPADDSSSVNTVWFETPGAVTSAGTHHYVLTLPEIGVRDVTPSMSVLPDGHSSGDPWHTVAGPWRFAFDLAVEPGTRLSPAATATADGVTATIGSVLVTPTTVRVEITYAGLPGDASSWASIATVLHDGHELGVGQSGASGGPVVKDTITTVTGADHATGSWVVRIDELVGFGPAGQLRITGPWELRFDAP
jgi:hypothetical protein